MEEPPALHPVKLYVYDLSKGMARRLSPLMLGKHRTGPASGLSGAGLRDPGRWNGCACSQAHVFIVRPVVRLFELILTGLVSECWSGRRLVQESVANVIVETFL